jgi:hypothetical protein
VTTPVAITPVATKVLTFNTIPPADAAPAPAEISVRRPANPPNPPENHRATGSGVIAVIPARSADLARCTSWRTAASERPMIEAISVRLCPCTALRISASC